jgi:hypothetical protein
MTFRLVRESVHYLADRPEVADLAHLLRAGPADSEESSPGSFHRRLAESVDDRYLDFVSSSELPFSVDEVFGRLNSASLLIDSFEAAYGISHHGSARLREGDHLFGVLLLSGKSLVPQLHSR